MCILRYAQNRLDTKCSPCSSFCLSQRERQLHENLFTAPTIICHPNATVPQGKACLLLLAGKCWGLCPPPYLANQAGWRSLCQPAATKDVPHQDLQPKGAYWRVTAHCHGLLRVFCTTTHSVPGMPWQHQSSGHRSLALLTLFQVSFDRFAEVHLLSQMALGWVWLLINVCHLGGAFAGSEYGNSVAPVCSGEDSPERSSKPPRH